MSAANTFSRLPIMSDCKLLEGEGRYILSRLILSRAKPYAFAIYLLIISPL